MRLQRKSRQSDDDISRCGAEHCFLAGQSPCKFRGVANLNKASEGGPTPPMRAYR